MQIIIFTPIYWFGFYFFDYALNGLLANLFDFIFGTGSYSGANSYVSIILVVVYILVIALFIYRAVAKAASYVDLITDSIDSLLDPHRPFPDFPPALNDVSIRLNDVKYDLARNAQLAREAEQRKNDLVVYLAHDLKTPLTSVIGYLTLLEESPELSVEQRAKYVSITLDKAYRLEQLINEFFDITRFNLQSITLEKNRIDLALMLNQMVDEFYPILSENSLKARVEAEPEMIVIGDADKLARVFDNLLRNAISYSYRDTVIEIDAKTEGNMVHIAFRNHGDEIPPANQARIFEKFFRLDSARRTKTGSAGLGLAIAKQIVELHNGYITVWSSQEYTEFTVHLPLRL